MKPLVIASVNPSAGKTSIVLGMARALHKSFAYLKPFGDRLLYRKKRQWDYDSALLTSVFDLEEIPELITLGFDHSKLRFMYDADAIRQKLIEMADIVQGSELFFIEGGKDLAYGASVHLDPITVAKVLDAQLVLVVSGSEGAIADSLAFIKDYLAVDMVNFAGVIINKVKDLDEFETEYLPDLETIGVPILGVLPFKEIFTLYPVAYCAEQLFAKVIAGQAGLQRTVRQVFMVTMGLNTAVKDPVFKREDTLVVTSGDRSDVILAAVQNQVAGIVLTDDIAPAPNIVSAADEAGIPLLLLRFNTAQTASMIDELDPLITKDDTDQIDLLEQLVKDHVDLAALGL